MFRKWEACSGSKLSINEHFAYLQMRQMLPKTDPTTGVVTPGLISERSFLLTAFALTGFANFSSVGIQLGGIGAIAPNRRSDLARLGMRALFVGFTATLLNASIAGILLEKDVAAASAPAKNDTQSPKETVPANDSTPSNASPQTVPSNPAVPETQTDSSTKSAQAAAIWALPLRNRIEQAIVRERRLLRFVLFLRPREIPAAHDVSGFVVALHDRGVHHAGGEVRGRRFAA